MSVLYTILEEVIIEYDLDIVPYSHYDTYDHITHFRFKSEEDLDKLKAVACLMRLDIKILSYKVNSMTLACLIDTQKIHSTGARLNRW